MAHINPVIPGLTRDPSLNHRGCRIKSGMTYAQGTTAFVVRGITNSVIPGLTRDPSPNHRGCRIESGMTAEDGCRTKSGMTVTPYSFNFSGEF
ncbi:MULTISPECIES: hypothetical protein [unclassified Limnohabitans]|jgi:hypothetical protein|uniref:hypothetical protein n=1 Tax=unclassified Limnohabitans TaxID=2626134 RepID=UPI0011B242F8|nr:MULTISPECIES: hypothetical protein [unclassified Limnohabitans]